MKLETPEELAIPCWPLKSNLDLDHDRPEENSLGEANIITIDKPLGADIGERQRPVLVAKVGEKRRRDGVGLDVQLAGDSGQDFVTAKASRWTSPVLLDRSWRR